MMSTVKTKPTLKERLLSEAKAIAGAIAAGGTAAAYAMGLDAWVCALVTLVLVPMCVHFTTNTPIGSLTLIDPAPAVVTPVVGDGGPEAVVLPAGTQVDPNAEA